MLNKCLLIGRLGKDPELRYTQSGTAQCKFSVATSETYKDKSGQKQEKTQWHNIVAWGKLAEICGQYLTKGKQVYIEGRMESYEYESNGEKRYGFQVVANSMQMLGGETKAAPRNPGPRNSQPEYDDDSLIPF